MPELPDLVYVERQLRGQVQGAVVQSVAVGDPTPLRIVTSGSFSTQLEGKRLETIDRRGHFLRFGFSQDLVLVVNAMLVGRYTLGPGPAAKPPKSLVFALRFEGGQELRYLDAKRMGKVYLTLCADEASIPGYGELGMEVLSEDFTRERFSSLVKGRREQVRTFLMDKRTLASIGNAYADEILFAAGLHPKTFCYQLSDEDRVRLYDSIRATLVHAINHIAQVGPDVSEKLRDFLKVRGRSGQPCEVCGTTLRSVRVGPADADFCPRCQPARRALFIDWSRTS